MTSDKPVCKKCGKDMGPIFRKRKTGQSGIWFVGCADCNPANKPPDAKPPEPKPEDKTKPKGGDHKGTRWIDDYV
jgi:hypothetical protein